MFSCGTQQQYRQEFFTRNAKEMRILSRSNTSGQGRRNITAQISKVPSPVAQFNRFQ